MPVLAVYIVPGQHEPLYTMGTSLLGYDVYTGVRSKSVLSEVLARAPVEEWIGQAQIYGLHATIGDALDYPTRAVPEICRRLNWIAGRIPPFTLVNGRFVKSDRYMPHALAATFDVPNRALHMLHYLVVTMINVLYRSSPFFERAREFYPPEDRLYMIRYGVPHFRILDRFDLHFSLATSIPDKATWQLMQATAVLQTGLFTHTEHKRLRVDAIHLLEQQPDGYFRIRQSFPLVGQGFAG